MANYIKEIKFFPLREIPILKRDTIEENHCLIQKSPFDVHNFFSILATPLEYVTFKNTSLRYQNFYSF